jgi:transmembrane sensor
MNSSAPNSAATGDAAIRDLAARWVVRQDRRLSHAEAVELEAWLAADARHAAAFKQSAASWHAFRAVGAAVRRMPVDARKPRPQWNWVGVGGLAAAAALVLAFVSFDRPSRPAQPAGDSKTPVVTTSSPPTTRRLADGSVARLKDGAEINEAYSAAERRIRLVRGEAYFFVTKDATRPFLVDVGDVTVRAVGTAFAIRFEPQAVDVLVTEGTVQVTPPAPATVAAEPARAPALVGAGHRAIVAHLPAPATPAIVVTAVSQQQIAQALAWNDPMLELAGAPLGELVTTFAQRSGRRIEIGDPALATVRIGGRFPTDDVDGFIRALEEIYDVKSEKRADGGIVLRKAR